MNKTYKIVSALVVIAVLVVGGYYVYQQHRARKAGLLTEKIEHHGDIWNADFTARIGAPEAQVFDAIRNIEKAHSDEIKSVQVISQNGNEKTVEMQVAGPAGQTITTRLAFQYFPQEHRIVYHTLDGGDFVTQAEYNLGDEGTSTLMKFHETTKVAQELPVPDGVVKQVIRGIFLAQLEGLKKALNINTAENDEDSDEP
ncbi:MAG TPA: SRPBCC family protein [Candidatus Binataceae bacterium]|nr:SRPBCC family protein [Candidatus Binataceae bacterium]